MRESARTPFELRVLVLTPTPRDAELSEDILERAQVPCFHCASLLEVVRELERGAAALVLPEESLDSSASSSLAVWLSREPPWSDLPILVLSQSGADSIGLRRAVQMLGNVTILERPTRVTAFVSAIRAALRARRRQYQVRDHLEDREATARAMLRRSEQLDLLTQVLPLINAAADVPSILSVLCVQARELIGARRCDTTLVGNQTSQQPISVTSSLEDESAASGMNPPAEAPPFCDSLSSPLVDSHGRNMGHMQLWRAESGEFSDEDETLIVQLAQLASIAIENALLVDSLREGDRRKDEFLAVLAHELRNPLAPLRNSLYLLRLTRQTDHESSGVTEMMERQVNHLVRLVDDLLEISRITRGNIELRMEHVRMEDVIQSALESSMHAIEGGRHEFVLTQTDHTLMLCGDPMRLGQIFSNLLNNAAKYTDPEGRISLSVNREGNEVVTTVRDTGIGISAEKLPQVFDLFMQADRSGSRAQGGLGIGLTLVERLVEMHGGRVVAHSAGPGLGSEFEVRLPLAREESETIMPAASRQMRGELEPRRVLVVDDNGDAAETLGSLLNMLGVDTRIAHSGAEALEALPQFQPQVVLLDIGMPEMDGHEVARRIRELPDFTDLLLVALTGWGQRQDRDKSRDAGFDLHLVKPVDLDALRAVLDSIGAHATAGSSPLS